MAASNPNRFAEAKLADGDFKKGKNCADDRQCDLFARKAITTRTRDALVPFFLAIIAERRVILRFNVQDWQSKPIPDGEMLLIHDEQTNYRRGLS